MKRLASILAVLWTGVLHAATAPFVQVVAPGTGLANTCGPSSTHATIRVAADLPAGSSWSYSIGYVYTMTDYYYGGVTSYDYYSFSSAPQNGPVTAGNAVLDIGTPSSWFGGGSYQSGTELLFYATTYSGPNGTGQIVATSRMSWVCSSGSVTSRAGSLNASGDPPSEVLTTPVVEFYNASLDHYFISAAADEIAALDSGSTHGWTRTGLTFSALKTLAPGGTPVCRFYLPPGNGDSHFYSASPSECDAVAAKFPTFIYEAPNVFYVTLPDTTSGACPAFTVPVYRVWNGRTDSNHRYTTDPAVISDMVARGYVREGYGPDAVIMCAPT